MKLRELNDMIYDMIDVHIGGIEVSKAIFVNFVDSFPDDVDHIHEVIGYCIISETFEQASLVFNVFDLDEASDNEQIDIICHELAHLICEEKSQCEDDVIADGHDIMWGQVVCALGGIPNYWEY